MVQFFCVCVCVVCILLTKIVYPSCSDEETDIKALVASWLKSLSQSPTSSHLEGWMEDYFYKALNWVISTDDFVVETTLVGVALNGLSHLVHVTNKSQFACALIKGLGGNLGEQSRLNFAKMVKLYVHKYLSIITYMYSTFTK